MTNKEIFILKANKTHHNKYDYSKVEYVNSRTNVIIICPKHGEFIQLPSNHVHGSGCPKCKNEKISQRKKTSLQDFILKSKKLHKNKFDYSNVHYIDSKTKVCIICPIHGEFWQSPNNHLKGCGCPKCGLLTKQNQYTREYFITEAKEIHGEKYDYSKVDYVNNHKKVCIICSEHGEFWQTPHSHLQGKGCHACGKKKKNQKQKYTTDSFIKKANKVHNNRYNYTKVRYVNSKTKVCIICPIHGEFWQTPTSHLQGCGCNGCVREKKSKSKKLRNGVFLQRLYNIYQDRYDYSQVRYDGYYNEVSVICKKHGVFNKKPIRLLHGHGCPKCAKEQYKEKRTYTNEEFIIKAKEVHGEKYDYSKINYVSSKTPINIICPKHGNFRQSPDKHLVGEGCPKCGRQLSKTEDDIMKFIKKYVNCQQRNKDIIPPYELDIYIPSKNIAIEYNGLVWHSEKFGKDKDYHLTKTIECEKKGIRLIHIFEDEWLEHKEIVKSKLKHILGCNNNLPQVFARKCEVKSIDYHTSEAFLAKNHIQGCCKSTVYLGCFYNNELVGVMTFKQEVKGGDKWELTRFAGDITKHCVGVGGKLFKYFVRKYKPNEIKSFADRRWSTTLNENLYDKLGFHLNSVLNPDYSYVVRNKRIHKFNFRKKILLRKFDSLINKTMTESEMTKKLGYYKIWNCGLIKYVWKNK